MSHPVVTPTRRGFGDVASVEGVTNLRVPWKFLKVIGKTAETASGHSKREGLEMVRSQLDAYCVDDPIWGFVAQLGSERFTGEAIVGGHPRVHLFADEGHVYFAEREIDAPLSSRLVTTGVISAEQLARGAVHVGGSLSLARMFQRDPSIDRDAVELTLQMLTDSLLEAEAQRPVAQVELVPLRHHPSGIDQWARSTPAPLPLPDPSTAPVPMPAPASFGVASFGVASFGVAALAPTPEELPPSFDDEMSEFEDAFAIIEEPVLHDVPVEEVVSVEEAVSVEEVVQEVVSLPTLPTLGTVTPWTQPLAEDGTPLKSPSRFDPTALEGLDLPKLASHPMSAADLADATTEATAEETPEESAAETAEATAEDTAEATLVDDPALDQPAEIAALAEATSPASPDVLSAWSLDPPPHANPDVDEPDARDEERPPQHTGHHAGHDTASYNMTAVEIWEMVDDLLDDTGDEPSLVTAGAPSDKKSGRGWRRGRKG
jgi:hypothetical protein